MKRIDYLLPRAAVVITSIAWLSHWIHGYIALTPKDGWYENLNVFYGTAAAIAWLALFAVFLLNTSRSEHV